MVDRNADSSRSIGNRIRACRESASLTQQQLSEIVGIGDRQTLSAIETGERRVQAAELVKIGNALKRPVDWFLDPFVVAGEAQFCWRAAKELTNETLDLFEDHIGAVVGVLRHLKTTLNGPAKTFAQTLRLPVHRTFEDAWAWGEAVGDELELGLVPSLTLVDQIEKRLDISVLFIDAKVSADVAHDVSAVSGAMCRLPELGVIVVNRAEPLSRRNFDVAHELFHALTWDAMVPDRLEVLGKPPRRNQHVERMADNFAAALLMPRASLDRLIPREHLADVEYLSNIARELRVSNQALAFRLLNARMISETTCDELKVVKPLKAKPDVPRLFSESFVSLLHAGIADGHVSSRKVAKALSLTLDELAELMQAYGKAVPFAV